MAKHLTTFTVLLALIVSLSNATDWCGITCKDPFSGQIYQHTMCTIKHNQPANKCIYLLKQGLDQSDVNLIINYHNEIRRSVANLSPLVWDETLAAVAQRWANQCEFQHDKCRNLGNAGLDESVGQNIGYKWYSDGHDDFLQNMMTDWVNEKSLVNRNIITSFPKSNHKRIGHYTQMVWAKTTKIGCGFVKFYEGTYQRNQYFDGYRRLLVCNYGPSGNVWGHPVY